MSTDLIQKKINEEADSAVREIIHAAIDGASEVENALRFRYPNSIDLDNSIIVAEVYPEGQTARVPVRVNEDLFTAIKKALFEAVREKARAVHTQEFVEKVRRMQ